MTENSMIKLNVYSEMINEELKKFAAEKPALRENICEAMDYSLTAGGKRLRPILMLEFCRMCGGNASGLMKTACSIELIHTFFVDTRRPAVYGRRRLQTRQAELS